MAPITGHVMISYQWDSQPEVMKIYEALKGYNFNIWIDIDKMSGDIYKKIADGVEGAEVIIVCMSSKYQESENCNSEFKYARDNRKNIIPIKMEKGFNATGPLGLITAGKHYIDFSNWSMFDNNMKRLKKEIESYIRSTEFEDMSNYHDKETEETVEEEIIVENGKENKSSIKSMRLQLTVEGEAEVKPNLKSVETQECPVGKGCKEEYTTQESTDTKTNKGLVNWMAHGTEEDDNQAEVQASSTGPPADYIGSKTIDDDLKPPVAEHRDMKTVEEEDVNYEPYQAFVAPKVIWKLLDVRPHSKNTDPISKMIHLLPAESITKDLGEWALFGRAENVDIYLHDLLSSRKHAEFTITNDCQKGESNRLVATIRNKSDTKKIKVNGNRELQLGDMYQLHSNDQISLGAFTFLIEIVQGDNRSKKYELKFVNCIPATMQPQGYLPSLYALPPAMQLPSLQPRGAVMGMHEGIGPFNAPHPVQYPVQYPYAEMPQNYNISTRISSPSSHPTYRHQQPQHRVENTCSSVPEQPCVTRK